MDCQVKPIAMIFFSFRNVVRKRYSGSSNMFIMVVHSTKYYYQYLKEAVLIKVHLLTIIELVLFNVDLLLW